MWTAKNRGRYDRSKLRYPSDLTDDEWAHVEPLIPPAKRGGNKRHVEVREVMDGIMYILSTGCQWRAIPKDLPPRSTLFDYLDLWSYDGTLDRIHHALYVECREQGEREASPTAAGVGRSLCSPFSRPFVCECHTISTMPRFQPPPRRTQRADFLALRSPVCFASRLMGTYPAGATFGIDRRTR